MATRQRKKKVTKSDFIPAGITPFDNGKIKMGIYYQKPKYVEEDSDMLRLQSYLIGDPAILKREYWIGVAYKLGISIILLITILANK